MTDTLVQGLASLLGGKVSGEVIIFIISMIPILELRGGLLAASPALLNVPILRAIPICVIGNLLPIPFILLLIEKILNVMERIPGLGKFAVWIRQKADKNKGQIEKFGFWGLVLFVGIPLPGTGAWTGSLVAALLHMKFGKAIGAILMWNYHGYRDHVSFILRTAWCTFRLNNTVTGNASRKMLWSPAFFDWRFLIPSVQKSSRTCFRRPGAFFRYSTSHSIRN